MSSLYWDDFERRINETVAAIKNNEESKVRRVAIFITNKCNFRCGYCRVKFDKKEMSQNVFNDIVSKYKDDAILHITGGEPSIVKWLYDYIDNTEARFHLNSNCYLTPPKNIKRLKVSLDSPSENYIDNLVGVKGAFEKIVNNIKNASEYTTTSITCVLSRETYLELPKMVDFCNKEFPKLYALFFSVYKGIDKRFMMGEADINYFFKTIMPQLKEKLNAESLWLLNETLDEKKRVLQGIRFPENKLNEKCYLSLSERVFDCDGNGYRCSHLFRDGIKNHNSKVAECQYGCNRKLVKFNQEVEGLLSNV
jgi:sulfatase maturation enzyme AslB (radical SAM superfamily)